VLENGLTILAKDSLPRDLAAIDIKIKAGSGLEGEYAGSGISHFVEHMVFKGTKTRAAGAIEKEIKSYGGFINAAASHDLTSFTVTVPSEHLKEAISLLKDMLLNATFEKKEFEKEREVILKEMKLNRDEPNARLSKLLYDTAYIGHPYRYPVIGYEQAFRALKREDLIKYYNKMYVPNRIVIAVVGGIDKVDAIAAIEKEFESFKPPNYMIDLQAVEPMQISARRSEEGMAISLSYLAMGFHSTRLLDKDLFAMDVLSMILGRGDNSRLNTVLFKEKEMVHSISSWNYTPKDPGLFVITASLDKENLGSVEKAVLDEVDKLKNEGAKDDEIEAAKRMVLSDYIFSRQTLEEEASDISANEVLTGDYAFSRRYVDGVQSVSKEDLKRVANKILRNDNLTVVRLVPASFIAYEPKAAVASTIEPTIKKEILPNGLRILVREDRKTPTISISVAMLGGLSVEDKHTNGISNLTARMLLKGTGIRKESDIEGALENRGGAIAPFSGFNSFGVNLTLLKPDLDFALDILKDILRDSTFPQDELGKP
ncbi:MAG: insulinase family protein, partial [Candidatus Omnitrophica bacterium]|nr:insulinase family protein [Candidatus Omnitrophota bacterium]